MAAKKRLERRKWTVGEAEEQAQVTTGAFAFWAQSAAVGARLALAMADRVDAIEKMAALDLVREMLVRQEGPELERAYAMRKLERQKLAEQGNEFALDVEGA